MRILFKSFIFLGMTLFLVSCGGSTVDEGEDYGNILDTPDGLILTEEEHQGGWGRADCTTCHNLENIHLVDRTGASIDIETIHDQAIEDGIAGCAACHGTNGI